MMESIGAFILGFGVLMSLWNFFESLRSGARAGANPWGADTLEWDMPSPPPAYATVHIPVVHSRHPLWDDFEEEYDPNGERILDHGRLTLTTTTLDAEIRAIARMPQDTMTPFWLALAMTVMFSALLLKLLWLALAGAIVIGLVNAVWLWPERERIPA